MLNLILTGAKKAEQLARHEPLVILSRGHSGTRVLTWMCAHLGFHLGTHESNPTGDADKQFTNRLKKLAAHTYTQTSAAEVRPTDLRSFRSAVWDYHRWLGAPATAWGWKFPETYLMGPLVALTFPRARYIHLVRDGRDIAFKSHLTDRTDNPVGHGILSACQALTLPHHVQAALSWEYQIRQFERFRTALPGDRMLDLRFEDLCHEPVRVADQLCKFLATPMTPACQSYVEHKVDAGKVAQYRHEAPEQVHEVEHRIGATLTRLGYRCRSLPVA